MITSQNVSSEAQEFFNFVEVMFNSQDIQVFILLTIPWLSKL